MIFAVPATKEKNQVLVASGQGFANAKHLEQATKELQNLKPGGGQDTNSWENKCEVCRKVCINFCVFF